MSGPGWYPDPEQGPVLLRYFDGRQWTAHTRPATRRRRTPWMIMVAVLLLLAVISTAAIIAVRTSQVRVITDEPVPESTISGWDDSSPLPTSTASASPSAAAPSADSEPCPYIEANLDRAGAVNGRVRGGRLSYPRVTGGGFGEPAPGGQLGWVHDRAGQTASVAPTWVARVEVGFLPVRRGFRNPRQAAESSMQCLISNGGYPGFTKREDVRDDRITVDGEPGWVLTSKIHDRQAPDFAGDRVTMIVVDDGTDRLLLWMGMVPIGDQPRIALMERTAAGLRVG